MRDPGHESGARARALSAFRGSFGREPALIVRAPGRVNLLGEHVDYCDGLVLPAAIDLAAWLAVAPRPDGLVRVAAADLEERVLFGLDGLDSRCDRDGRPLPRWALYPAGVAQALARRGGGGGRWHDPCFARGVPAVGRGRGPFPSP
ncbi:MAG: hypothetical protein HY720_18145, partial [Planctomycetes bacterium]|nr:hypothetical protein [Planctomycetota bacterium]